MKNLSNKRKVKITLIAILVLVVTIGGAYALWSYSKTLGDQTLIAGDIFLKYTEGDTINIKEAMPSITYNPDEYFQFTVEGKNSYKKDIVYEILLDEGDKPTGEGNETRTEPIKPELLKFRLVEVKDGKEEELIQEGNYDSLEKKRIWVDRVKGGTKENIKYTYRLYMWISNEAKIGNMEGADYTTEVWNNNVYASVKVGVNGDFTEKELTEDYMILNATDESGKPYDLKQPIQANEDIIVTLGSKREITKFVVSKSSEYPIALMSLPEATDYEVSYNEATRAWETKVTIDETGIYDYYAVYDEEKGINSETYSFTVLMNPDRYVLVEKPTSALCKQGLTYTGSPQDLIDSNNLDQTGYLITQVQGTDANSYEVSAKLKKNFRWKDSSKEDATFNCTIGPKETVLTYEPTSDFKVGKGLKKSLKIVAPTEGTFNVTSKASGIASVTVEPSSGASTTVTVQGVEIGSTSLDINFTPSNNNYTIKTDTYNIEVFDPIATSVLKNTKGKTGGIIGITEESEKTTDKGASNIREYRYSGLGVNNYVTFNDETWRILGVFKDENGEELVKIVKNEVLSSSIMPDTYIVGEKNYKIKNNASYNYGHWDNDGNTGIDNWSDAGLMYWLNSKGTDDSDVGYLKKLSNNAQNMIVETKYYLGTLTYYSDPIDDDEDGDSFGIKESPIEAYNNERAITGCQENKGPDENNVYDLTFDNTPNCRVWANNAATWTGKIGLMYPSDYGFSTDSSYWNVTMRLAYFDKTPKDTSWLQKETDHVLYEWFLSPNSGIPYAGVTSWAGGNIDGVTVNGYACVRPTLYLKSDVKITGGEGTSSSPYVLQ